MIEKIINDFLNEKMSLPCYTEIPASPPLKFYAIERTGGGSSNHISSATVAIQSVADTLYDAVSMNEELKEVMLYELIALDEIVKVELNSDYNFTDTQTKKRRYQAVFDIKYY